MLQGIKSERKTYIINLMISKRHIQNNQGRSRNRFALRDDMVLKAYIINLMISKRHIQNNQGRSRNRFALRDDIISNNGSIFIDNYYYICERFLEKIYNGRLAQLVSRQSSGRAPHLPCKQYKKKKKRAISSAGSEHLPYKQGVVSSNLTSPTQY